jgi:hypothetical protein
MNARWLENQPEMQEIHDTHEKAQVEWREQVTRRKRSELFWTLANILLHILTRGA